MFLLAGAPLEIAPTTLASSSFEAPSTPVNSDANKRTIPATTPVTTTTLEPSNPADNSDDDEPDNLVEEPDNLDDNPVEPDNSIEEPVSPPAPYLKHQGWIPRNQR